MTDRKPLSQAIRDARAGVLFGKTYASLTPAQKQRVEELMRTSHKYAVKGNANG